MKKIIMAFLCLFLVVSITGCGKKEKEEEVSNKDKINLNDNVYYYVEIELNGKDCGGYAFPSNVNDIISDRWITSDRGMNEVDKIELFSHSDIEFDYSKETLSLQEWNDVEVPILGVSNFEKGFEDHQFYAGYYNIVLVKDVYGTKLKEGDTYYKINKDIQDGLFKFRTDTRTIINSREGYHLKGTCGGGAIEPLLLDEKVCKQYNLDCDRW